MLESPFNKVAGLQALKRDPIQLFSCEYCKHFKNTYFEEFLRTPAFEGFQIDNITCELKQASRERERERDRENIQAVYNGKIGQKWVE